MTSSSYTWAGRKLTPQELISSQRTDPLPHIVKLTQVPSEYEKSCPQMANGTVLWLYGSAEEERVALKTTDKNPKYISVPLETPIKFEVVHTHEHGPPTLLSSMLRGKVQSDLKVEMAGNAGNRLSPTPDQTQSVPYGSLQVVGIYKEGVLQAQTIINVAGELNPLRRNLSVNCPVHLDIATGLYGKSAEEFQKLKERLKKNQSSKATNQTETSYDIALLSGVPKSLRDVHLLRHVCQLSITVSATSPRAAAADAADPAPKATYTSTAFKAAVAKLTDKVGSDIISKPKPPREVSFLSNSSVAELEQPTDTRASKSLGKTGSRSGQLTYEIVETPSKPTGAVSANEGLGGRAAGPREKTAKGEEDVGSRLTLKSTLPRGPKDGVYIKDWKHSEAERLAKAEVPQPPAIPASLTTSSSSAVPKPPAYRSPPKVPSSTSEIYEDYQGEYEIPVETDKRLHLPLPSTPSESEGKVKKQESTGVSSTSEKTGSAVQTKLKLVFGGLKDKLANAWPKDPSVESRSLPADVDGGETYDSLVFYENPADEDLGGNGVKREEADDDDQEEGYEVPEDVPKWRTLSQVPKDVKSFSIAEVSLCLRLLGLDRYVRPFREKSVDGALLRKLNKKTLVQTFQMQEFEAKQLVAFARDNWRPKI